jgi:hypothetical protein
MTIESPIRIISQPGIKRDGTLLEGENYVDGQWCRWHRGLPRKINGYRNVAASNFATEKIYGLHAFASNSQEYIHGGSATKFLQYVLDYNATFLNSFDRTPVGGFDTISTSKVWQIVDMYDSISNNTRIIAHAGQNLLAIDSDVESNIFFGDITGTGALVWANGPGSSPVSGGICYIAPYLFRYGNSGRIDWSVINNPNDWSTGLGTAGGPGSARVTGSKVIKGLPLRGGGSGPAGIFWSLDSLIRASFVQGFQGTFAFDTLSDEISVLSSSAIVEVDGIYYWPGVDRFMMFNGVAREIPNNNNLNWFYDNINYQYRQKCFALKIPRWGEIWWCYPRGGQTECTDAVIYNYREDTWYDTVLPNGGRTSGTFANTYEHPFMMGLQPTPTDGLYRLWKHEETVSNEIDGMTTNTVRSFFETNEISLLTQQQAQDKSTRVAIIEPDFVQTGDMTVTVFGRANARATDVASAPITFPDNATGTPDQQIITLEEVRRLMRFRFESNTVDGNYQMGQCLAHVAIADSRRTD